MLTSRRLSCCPARSAAGGYRADRVPALKNIRGRLPFADAAAIIKLSSHMRTREGTDMLKITLEVEGMRCGMCETHVNDVVRRVDGVKKVKSSHAKGRTEVVAEDGTNIGLIKEAIAKQGYGVGKVETEPYEKRGLFSRKG